MSKADEEELAALDRLSPNGKAKQGNKGD